MPGGLCWPRSVDAAGRSSYSYHGDRLSSSNMYDHWNVRQVERQHRYGTYNPEVLRGNTSRSSQIPVAAVKPRTSQLITRRVGLRRGKDCALLVAECSSITTSASLLKDSPKVSQWVTGKAKIGIFYKLHAYMAQLEGDDSVHEQVIGEQTLNYRPH